MSKDKHNNDKDKTALMKTGAGALAAPVDYGSDSGSGFENQTREDISIPFLAVIQSNSPQLQDFEGARPGMLYNTVTQQFVDGKEGVVIIPALTQHVFVEWIPRTEGGGFVAVHGIDSDVVKKAKAEAKEPFKYKVGENDLVETFYVYASVIGADNEANEFAVIACKSKFIGPYKKWNTSLNMFMVKTPDGRKQRPPLFAHQVRLTTWPDKNKKGSFFNVKFTPLNGTVAASLLPPGDPRLESAKSLKELVEGGLAKAAYDSQQVVGDDAGEETTAKVF